MAVTFFMSNTNNAIFLNLALQCYILSNFIIYLQNLDE